MSTKALFEVDKEGLAKIAGRRGKAFILYELFQNAWDAPGCTRVDATISPCAGVPYVDITIEDDSPDGFQNLSHAWTLFAESQKKGNPELRGRFNLGEKLVIACCRTAEITSTTGGVRFDGEGRHTLRKKRDAGSVFVGEVRMTRDEYDEVYRLGHLVLPPGGIVTTLNGIHLPNRPPRGTESLSLPTEVPDEEGYLRRRERRTLIHIHEPHTDEKPMLFEMGIPVMELEGDRWSVDVQQKVPLTLERDGVHPSYLRKVRAAVLNTMSSEVTAEDVGSGWVKDALQSPDVVEQAVNHVLDAGFGKKRVTYDPSDQEANCRAMAAGYTVVPAAALPSAAWDNVRRFGASLPAGKVTPTPKPFSPGGDPLKTVASKNFTYGMTRVAGYAIEIAARILRKSITVVIANDIGWPPAAAFGPDGVLYLNLGRLGHAWFDGKRGLEPVNKLLIHEFAHNFESNHLADGFHEACCRLGAQMVSLAIKEPDLFHVWPEVR